MPDLLLELLSEEIPARMQRRAAEDLKSLVTNALVERGLTYEGAKAFATPRRLALTVAGLPLKGRDVREERKGPRVGAPDAAVQGFLKSAGLADLSEAKIETDPKKGAFYVAVVEKPGQATVEAIAAIMPDIIRSFPWPKSMRWGAASAPAGAAFSPPEARGPEALRWVRPLQSILCTFGPETEEPEIVPFEVDGIASGDTTRGHRFLAPAPFRVKRFDDYATKLEKAFVMLDADRRKDVILADARTLAMAQSLDLVEDEALLEEVAGLVEWPVVLMGAFDESFLAVPPEVIRATIRANQKCFVLKAPHPAGAAAPSTLSPLAGRGTAAASVSEPTQGEGRSSLAAKFLLTSNMIASDGGATIVAGNARVIRARLSDALYFWTTDQGPLPDYVTDANRAKPLDQRLAKLKALDIVFHEKLGTQGERVARIAALARELAPLVGADPDLAERAANLAKADLMTEVVGEFPETQGLMGRRYAQMQGEHPSVCAAIEEHYKPQGPNDRVPSDPVSVAVALADKLDTLVGFWAIDEKPTGSKDPYALRRAALGVIRLVVENGIKLSISASAESANKLHCRTVVGNGMACQRADQSNPNDDLMFPAGRLISLIDGSASSVTEQVDVAHVSGCSLYKCYDVKAHYPTDADYLGDRMGWWQIAPNLLSFFHDRLKVLLREQGARHDLVDAVLSGGDAAANDDLLLIVRRVEALGAFLATDDGRNLLAGWRRAANILRAEEKKDGAGAFDSGVDPALLAADEEKALHSALNDALPRAEAAVAREDYAGAMRALAGLRAPVDSFFDKVTVNAGDSALRANRLRLLNRLRSATAAVADFGKITG